MLYRSKEHGLECEYRAKKLQEVLSLLHVIYNTLYGASLEGGKAEPH